MRVVRVGITNFRSVKGPLPIELRSPHSVLVGSNNAGKSNILAALEWVLRRQSYRLRPHSDDYFDPRAAIVIVATLGDISEDDKKNLYPLCTNKQQRGALGSKDSPEITMTLKVAPLDSESAGVDDGETAHATGEQEPADGDEMEPGTVSLEISLWGFPVHRRVADCRARLVHLLVVSPVRRIDDELSASRWTPYGELMKSILQASPQFSQLQGQLADVTAGINTAFADQKVQLLADARIVTYVDDLAFQLTKNNDPAELLRNLEIVVTEDGRSLALGRVGTGTQSAVIIGMLELVLRAGRGDTKVFAVEEPDAFIHPHGVRHLASLVKRLSEEPSSQVVLSTHSPSLLATLRPGEIVRVEKRDGQTQVSQAKGSLDDATFRRYINQDTAEIFFAKRVVLVEGPTERFLLPPVASRVKYAGQEIDFAKSCISIVDIGGKSGVLTYLKLLHEFEIEAFAILDSDVLGDPTCKAVVKYLRARGAAIDDSSDNALRRDLAKANIFVLSKGEVEDYIPEADVVAASGQDQATVSSALAAHAKTSDAFKQIFRMGKPQYAQTLAELYISGQAVPQDLERIIIRIGT